MSEGKATLERSVNIVTKSPLVDLLISPTLSDSQIDSIVSEFGDGLPDSYIPYRKEGIFINSDTNPTLLVKKRILGTNDVRRFRERDKFGGYTAHEMNASVSLVNEFRMADAAEAILMTEPAQEYAKSLGFDGITLIKPLAGVITRPNGEKHLIYPFVNGVGWCKHDSNIGFQDTGPVQPLIDLFLENGIDPVDLVARQIMIVDNTMVLTDMEIYHPVYKEGPVIGVTESQDK